MAFSINKITLLGNLGRDAETTYTSGGKAITKFSVCTERSYKKGDEWVKESNWTNVVLFGQEKIAELLTKGATVYVDGRLENSSFDGKDGVKKYVTNVIADNVIIPNRRYNVAGNESWDGNSDDSEQPF